MKNSFKSILFTIMFLLFAYFRGYSNLPSNILSIVAPISTVSLITMVGYKLTKGIVDVISSKTKIRKANIEQKGKLHQKKKNAKRSILFSLLLIMFSILRHSSTFLPINIAIYIAPLASISLCTILSVKFLSSTINILKNSFKKRKCIEAKIEPKHASVKSKINQKEIDPRVKKLKAMKEVINEYSTLQNSEVKTTQKTKLR